MHHGETDPLRLQDEAAPRAGLLSAANLATVLMMPEPTLWMIVASIQAIRAHLQAHLIEEMGTEIDRIRLIDTSALLHPPLLHQLNFPVPRHLLPIFEHLRVNRMH